VLFVNPVPRGRFDLMTGSPTRAQDLALRRSYLPLEAALRDGETLRLFLPGIVYLGFTTGIPAGSEDAECFYFEQRGWLDYWGRGQRALLRQASIQADGHRWAAAESTFARVRALGDTLPAALRGQLAALAQTGRAGDARRVAEEYLRRWPTDAHAGEVRSWLEATRAAGAATAPAPRAAPAPARPGG
jgi:hypothetical protein